MAWTFGKPRPLSTRQKMQKPHPSAQNNQNSRKKKWAPPGMSTHPLFQCYYQMVKKCTNPEHDKYKYYGKVGATVCDHWLQPDGQGFLNFLNDMGDRPANHNLERIESHKEFRKDNCIWKERE
jgi:hypothetical protein